MGRDGGLRHAPGSPSPVPSATFRRAARCLQRDALVRVDLRASALHPPWKLPSICRRFVPHVTVRRASLPGGPASAVFRRAAPCLQLKRLCASICAPPPLTHRP